ncbi:ABC transporter permease [Polycladidibacter hongkongensis]|uniref:ABC transporter permease n=1 Tax=Polycladidibacter hongkongensis TaxID=1647556 RepID=UPI0008374851|nr:ABC transporter permease [Pseudovibrio hongkongensis]
MSTTSLGAASSRQNCFALAARFALREMRGGLRGFYVFIACIALGVAAITGVQSFSSALTTGIEAQGQEILGGDAAFSLIHREATEQQQKLLTQYGNVSHAATMRAMAREPQSSAQTLVEIKAVDSAYPLYGAVASTPQLAPAALSSPAQDGFYPALVEPALLERLNISVGQYLNLGQATLRVAAVLDSEPDKLGSGMTFGPRVLISQEALAQTGLMQPGSLVTHHYRVRLPGEAGTDAIAQLTNAAKEQFPDAGWRIRSRTQAAPSLQNNITRFAQFLSLVGITALIVGGVGVAGAVRSYLGTKRETIAALKCLGASGDFVFRLYLLQIIVIASLGIVLGLIAGAILPVIALALLGSVLPFEASATFYLSDMALGAVFGLLTATAFALWPLGRAHDVPPTVLFRDDFSSRNRRPHRRYLIAAWLTIALLATLAVVMSYDQRIAVLYVAACAGVYLLLMLVARLIMATARRVTKLKSTEWRLAVGNIHRPGALTQSVILSLGLGLSLLVALALIDGNLRNTLQQTAEGEAPSFFFLDVQNYEKDAFDALLAEQAPDAKVQSAPMLRGRITKLAGTPTEELNPPADAAWVLRGDRGITYAAKLPENSELTSGEWWSENDSGEPLVSFDDELAGLLGVKIGDMVTINVLGRQMSARIANTRTVKWESMAINFVMVFSPNTFAGAPHTHLTTVAWPQQSTLEQEIALQSKVVDAFPTVTAIRVKDAITQVNELIGQLAWGIRGASSITLIASVLVLAGALAAGHQSRIYDAVILKTLGATRGRLIHAYIIEYALLGLAAAVFSLIAGGIAAWFVMVHVMDGSFTFLPITALAATIAALLLTIGFGLVGTWQVLGKKPAPNLRSN